MSPDERAPSPPPPATGGEPSRSESSSNPSQGTESKDRKERVIHTRVPAVLEAELKKFAENLRVPVSNLIRTILEDAVNVADKATESVERELRTAAQRVNDERERLKKTVQRPDPLEGVYGFQPLVMNVHSTCAKCSVPLEPGSDAHLAMSDRPGPRLFVCPSCIPGRKPRENP